MKIYHFLTLILVFASIQKTFAQNADEEAIKKIILDETKHYLLGDSAAWKATWLHDTKAIHTYASSSFYENLIGWDSIERGVIRRMVFDQEPNPIEIKNENYIIRVSENLATADFDQRANLLSDTLHKSVNRSHRVLVKDNGEWKIASVAGYDNTSWEYNRNSNR